MTKSKKKKKLNTDNNRFDTRTIFSINPFNKYDTRIIDFMCSVSKRIYNSTIYCHQIYDLFYDEIYNELIDFCNKNKNNTYKIIHDKLFDIYDKYYNIYSDNIKVIKSNSKLVWSYVYELNKTSPIINSNYFETKKKALNCLFNVKCGNDNMNWYVFMLAHKELDIALDWFFI